MLLIKLIIHSAINPRCTHACKHKFTHTHTHKHAVTRTHTRVLSQLWCYGACRARGMAKMVRKSKCQRKLLIVSAVAFALPFRRQEMWRQRAKEPWKNKKPHNVKNQVAGGEEGRDLCAASTSARDRRRKGVGTLWRVAWGYLATSFGQQRRACRSGFLNFAIVPSP